MSDAQYFPLIINSSNLVSSSFNNVFRYQFPGGAVRFQKSKVAVASIGIFYSWQNITAGYGNNTYQIIYPTSGAPLTITITMPDGFYDVSALNTFLQQQLILNGLYLVNSTGDFVYYCEILENSTYYGLQLNTYPLLASGLPAGWTNPAGMTFPAVDTTPQFVILANAFRDVIGFTAGSYPAVAQATNYSVLSSYTPVLTPIESLILSCSLLNNRYSVPNTVLYSFTSGGTTYGNLISSSPAEFSFVDIQDGNYPYFDVEFLDQNFNKVLIKDTNLIIQLLIRNQDNNY